MDLTQLKEVRSQLHNVFFLLYNAEFKGQHSEAVYKALRFIDDMAGKIQVDIQKLEPVRGNESTPAEAEAKPSL